MRPKTASSFKSMTPETVTLSQALQLLTLPREVGVAPDGEVVTAANGKFGPYLTKGKESRSLESEPQLFSISLEDALVVLAQPKKGRQQRGSRLLRCGSLGTTRLSGGKVVLKQGRFGPYVTDGETNASLRTGDDAATITPERAYELLVLRREREASNPKKGAKKKAPKKASKAAAKKATVSDGDAKPKKAAAKKPAKKAPAKKSATKKPAKPAVAKAGADSDGAAAKKAAKKSVEVSPDV